MDGWNTTFLLGRPIFRGYVSFREGISFNTASKFRSLNHPKWCRILSISSMLMLSDYEQLEVDVLQTSLCQGWSVFNFHVTGICFFLWIGMYIHVAGCLISGPVKLQLNVIRICTPQKSNIDTKNCHVLKGATFSKPSFWVSMLVFGSVYTWKQLRSLG